MKRIVIGRGATKFGCKWIENISNLKKFK